MAEHKRYVNLDRAMCRELEKLDQRYATESELSDKDLERADKMMHYLKSGETYYVMKEAGMYNGMSGARYPRPKMMSRDYPEDGYSRNWHPMEYIDPYYDRR